MRRVYHPLPKRRQTLRHVTPEGIHQTIIIRLIRPIRPTLLNAHGRRFLSAADDLFIVHRHIRRLAARLPSGLPIHC